METYSAEEKKALKVLGGEYLLALRIGFHPLGPPDACVYVRMSSPDNDNSKLKVEICPQGMVRSTMPSRGGRRKKGSDPYTTYIAWWEWLDNPRGAGTSVIATVLPKNPIETTKSYVSYVIDVNTGEGFPDHSKGSEQDPKSLEGRTNGGETAPPSLDGKIE